MKPTLTSEQSDGDPYVRGWLCGVVQVLEATGQAIEGINA